MLFNHDPFLLFISFFLIELDFFQSFYDLILRVFAVPVDSLAVVNDRDVESWAFLLLGIALAQHFGLLLGGPVLKHEGVAGATFLLLLRHLIRLLAGGHVVIIWSAIFLIMLNNLLQLAVKSEHVEVKSVSLSFPVLPLFEVRLAKARMVILSFQNKVFQNVIYIMRQ